MPTGYGDDTPTTRFTRSVEEHVSKQYETACATYLSSLSGEVSRDKLIDALGRIFEQHDPTFDTNDWRRMSSWGGGGSR